MARSRRGTAFLLANSIACAIACGSDEYECIRVVPPTGPVRVTVTADKCDINYGATITLTCTYSVFEDYLPSYVAHGNFKVPPTAFTVVYGDSSWADTVLVNEVRTHKVVIRPLVRGELVADAIVIAPIDSFNGVRGARSVYMRVK